MKDYFSELPKTTYPYTMPNGVIGRAEMSDLSIRFKIIEKILETPNSYYEYYWKDEDRIDIVADKYYGDSKLAWIVMLSAEAFDGVYDLPLTEEVFDHYLKTKYKVNDVNELRFKIHHYEDISGTVIDINMFNALNDFNKKAVMIYDYEYKINEKKRNIKLLSKAYVGPVLREFTSRIQDLKNKRRLLKT